MTPDQSTGLDPQRDYPLGLHHPELLHTPTGKTLDDLSLEAVLEGKVTAEDLRITKETLELQAEIADKVSRRQLGENLRRAGELTVVPDDRVLEIYNSLRPRASTKEQLLAIATELEDDYGASICADFVRDAAEVYDRRNILATVED